MLDVRHQPRRGRNVGASGRVDDNNAAYKYQNKESDERNAPHHAPATTLEGTSPPLHLEADASVRG